MDTVDGSLKKLLKGEVVPLTEVDVTYETEKSGTNGPSFIPIVKRTVTYIVMAILFDDQDRVLLVQEAKASCRGSWYLPAGRVEKGETLLDGVKREVLEEAGLHFEPLSLIGLEICTRAWYRFLYVGKAIGGKLKTLAEQDSESLQANWFTIDQIEKRMVELRAKDIIKPIQMAYDYIKKSPESRHPCSSVVIQPHKHLIHRPVIYKLSEEGSLEVLCCKKNELHIPTCYIHPAHHDSLNASLCDILASAFREEFYGKVFVQGILTVEHNGEPAEVHDGICFTTAVTITSKKDLKTIEQPKNSDFVWCSISDCDILTEFKRRLFQKNLLIPINFL